MMIKDNRYWFKIVRNILVGLFLGCFLGLFYISNSQTFKKCIEEHIKNQIMQQLDVACELNLDSIDWLSCTLRLSGLHIYPENNHEDNWSIMAEKIDVAASWLTFLYTGKFKVSVKYDQMMLFENFEKHPEHLLKIVTQLFALSPDSIIVFDQVSIVESCLILKKRSDDLKIIIPFVCNLCGEQGGTRVQFFMNNSMILHRNVEILKQMTGSIVCDVAYQDPWENLTCSVDINGIAVKNQQDVATFLTGKMSQGSGCFQLKTQDGSIVIDPISISCTKDHCWCDIEVSVSSALLSYMQVPDFLYEFAGKLKLLLHCDLYDMLPTLNAGITCNDVVYQSVPLISGARLSLINPDKKGFDGFLNINNQDLLQVHVDHEEKNILIKNIALLMHGLLPTYKIDVGQCIVSINYKNQEHIIGQYQCIMQHDYGHDVALHGHFELKNGIVRIWGRLNKYDFELHGTLVPEASFTSFSVFKDGTLLIDASSDDHSDASISGAIDFSVIKDLVSDELKASFAQEGSLVFRGKIENGLINAMVHSHYAHIRIPYVYNVIQNFSASFLIDVYRKMITCKNIELDLYQGHIACQQAKIVFNKFGYVDFIHAPFIARDVMLSFNKSLYAIVNGNILISKKDADDKPLIKGQLMLEKSEIKENIFSIQGQNLLSSSPENNKIDSIHGVHVDVSLFTKEQLLIDTAFLQAHAQVGMHVQGPIEKLIYSGSLELTSGQLNFPYKPLYINAGKLVIVPEQSFDPVIDFVAKGKVKQYQISLKAWGSVLDPHLKFESEPYLSEEQIIALLLLGVQDQSLSFMVPAFLTQRLTDLIFGPAMSHNRLQSFFDILLQSLKYVRFIPEFSNKTGRGGVRGVFEIDATEHLQGKIDTNFTHLEDTKFDIDYAATDDVTLRLQKDGPSMYGGQVEFRWKFS